MKTAAVILPIALLAAMIHPAIADENSTPPELPDPAAAASPAASIPDSSSEKHFENWNLEPSVQQAQLIIVARVANISEVTIVEGAKTDKTFREYRFTPVRILKGLFQRDELAMTAGDLGLPPGAAALDPHLKEGEYRLLILVQQAGNPFGGGLRSFGCVTTAPGVTTFAQRVPLLSGPEDPLVGVVETLIDVTDSRSRRERTNLLIERLMNTDGIAVVPLLTSLQTRADWAAADRRLYGPLPPYADASSPKRGIEYLLYNNEKRKAIRSEAVELLRQMLATGIVSDDPEALKSMADALRSVLKSDETHTAVRVAAIEALGYLFARGDEIDRLAGSLAKQLTDAAFGEPTAAATYAERTAVATALSRTASPEEVASVVEVVNAKTKAAANISQREGAISGAVEAVTEALEALPLDAPTERESVHIRAAIRLDPSGTEETVLSRLEQSIIARQSLQAEINALGRLRGEKSVPLLLKAANKLHTSAEDRLHIAHAFGRLGNDQAVPVLADWLREGNDQLKDAALTALEMIDSNPAAQAVRPLLDSESSLVFKLRIARLLARHGIDDGYALATEHLVDQTAWATLVLVALDDPRAAEDLSAVLEGQPPRKWRAAALTALAAIGDKDAKQKLLEILADDRHPLAAEAAQAVGLCADPALLPPLAELVQSRNKKIAEAALLAIRRFFSGVRESPRGLAAATLDDGRRLAPPIDVPEKTRAALFKAVSSLVSDPYVNSNVRQQAFNVARILRGKSYEKFLAELADQADLEGTDLLKSVQAERRRGDRL